ncbi:glutathione S-transferase [Hyaloraphidium curvatum]|nr:glutathione S-transferase [Hyaloraphidium curvatum]
MASLGTLHFSPTSPYARKVAVVAKEHGIWDRIEKFAAAVAPNIKVTTTDDANPLAKVPALVLPSGESLYDSPVICEYLDSLSAPKFFPSDASRWKALRLQALADGILDAAILVRYENALRPEEFRWKDWTDGQMKKVHAALAQLEKEADSLAPVDKMTIGEVTTVCAIGYLRFRFPELAIPPKVAAYYAKALERESISSTEPPK